MSTIKRIKKELTELESSPINGCRAFPSKPKNNMDIDSSSYHNWEAYIEGPEFTPYEGGIFQLKINFPPEYPFRPPKVNLLLEFFIQILARLARSV